MSKLDNKFAQLKTLLGQWRRVAVAFSGGADSVLVLKVAADVLGVDRVMAVTARSASLPAAELEEATRLADLIGVRHVLIDTDELHDPHYAANQTDRCYYCKTTLYEHMQPLRKQYDLSAILNGANADDFGDFRPGLSAAAEFGICSPLADVGLTKPEVRTLSARLGLPTFDKPSAACLSSRVQYGERITAHKLRMIESAEVFLKSLGVRECRVRHHNDLARIEVHPSDFARLVQSEQAARIRKKFLELGYIYVTLDLQGFRSGSMNEALAVPLVQVALGAGATL